VGFTDEKVDSADNRLYQDPERKRRQCVGVGPHAN
jgi:hypothetical protein